MKNLALLTCVNVSVPKIGNEDAFLAVDSDNGRIYFNSPTDIVGVDPSLDEETFAIGLEDLADVDVKIAGLQFLQGEESLCVATEHGDLLLINIHTKSVECVGSVESGLSQMKWSPDQELMLLGTGHETVIVMTREFDPVAEVNIHAEEFGEGEFINVGWGKKETQFHGSEGKGAAVQKKENIQPACPWDDGKIGIVWRGDGQNFAVSLIDPKDGNRKFRVWSRECLLQYTSEYMSGLESAFAWRPSGNLLASSQRKPHRHDIVFFEKNGLQHGEFTLPFGKDEMKVKQLEWNSDSSILAIWLTNLEKNDGENSMTSSTECVQLWTMSNYHWYLKQSQEFISPDIPVCVQWDGEQAHKLHILCQNGGYRQFVFSKTVHNSNPPVLNNENAALELNGVEKERDELSFVAVIDGKNILMTPFKVMVVPPPMCAYKLTLPSEANSVAFCAMKHASSDFAVIMKNNKVAFFSTQENERTPEDVLSALSMKLDAAGGNGFNLKVSPHKPHAILNIDADCQDCQDSVDISALHHWIWLDSLHMFAVSPGNLPDTDCAVLFEIDHENSKLSPRKLSQMNGLALSVHLHADDCIAIQLQDGTMLRCEVPSLDVSAYTSLSGQALKLPRPCLETSSCSFLGTPCIIGLSEHSRIYIDDTEITSDCSSFCIHDDYLFMTTHAHKLKCVSRNVTLGDVKKYFLTPADGRSSLENCAIIETHRALERGSKIVTVTPSDSRLVLQMPRGNLELIHPRCLVLSQVARFIKALEYGEAFTIMKKHRINMNLLCGIDMQLFQTNVDKFITELESTTNLNIFISDLQNEDLKETMYKQYFFTQNKDQCTQNSVSAPVKINEVCDLLIEEMEKSPQKYITSLITAHVKKQPSEVGKALVRIKHLSEIVGHEEKLISDALTYMTVLVDSNTLFNEALGTYDFKLVLMVAEKSQLDPKEFLPTLRELQNMGEDYRKYKIDVRLRRFSTALQHISKCNDQFEECLDFIIKHELYDKAVKLFEEGSERYCIVCQAYGEFLSSKNKFEEAGIMFSRCQDLKKALECFSSSKNFSLALATAYKLKLEHGEVVELAYKIAEKAKTIGCHSEAVQILEHHARDIELAVETALEGHLWQQAIRITEQYQRTDLTETHIFPVIKEAQEQMYLSLEAQKDLLIKHTARLQTVRQLKEKHKMQALLEGVEGVGIDSDLYSDTSSTMAGSVTSRTSTSASRTTGRTAKSRRKKEKRGYSLKEGSKFEDLALLHSLKVTIRAVNDLADDVYCLCINLALLRLDTLAERIQQQYSDVRAIAENIIPTIWSRSALQEDDYRTGPQSTVNSIVASMQNRRPTEPRGEVGDEKQDFADLELFVPPLIDKKSPWKVNLYTN